MAYKLRMQQTNTLTNECYCDDGALITSDATQRGYTQQTLITFGLL